MCRRRAGNHIGFAQRNFWAVFERKRPFLSENQVQCRENIKNKMWPKVAFVCEQFTLTHATGRGEHCFATLPDTVTVDHPLSKQRLN